MNSSSTGKKGWLWLLLLPFIGVGWPGLYASMKPEVLGFPEFYWYPILWIVLTGLITWIVYGLTSGAGGHEE